LASFYGKSFIYDSVPSEIYDLRILSFDSGESDGEAGSETEVFEKYVYRKSRAYYYGKTQNTPLEFDITVGSFNNLSGIDRNLIEKWLLGRQKYLPFQIVQDDIADVVFNVMFTSSKIMYVGNVQKGITLHGRCDAPWGFTFPKTITVVGSDAGTTLKNFDFYNDSADTGYLYPTTIFTMNANGGNISLKNSSDANREFKFTGNMIQSNEVITIDNYNQIVTSSTGEYRLAGFNKNWFRIIPGLNKIVMEGSIKTLTMTYSFARKVGA
jgi:hypothetical protein